MKLKLPQLIETLVQATNESDVKKYLSCFSKSATILDEGETLIGHEAIGQWFTKVRKKYSFQTEPISIEETADKIVMIAKVEGSFPGSPVNLKFQIKIESGLIQDLETS